MHSRKVPTLFYFIVFLCFSISIQTAQASLADRLEHLSRSLLGKPYLLGALGEGNQGRYDQSPLSRMDAFDCETWVDTVLALAFSHDQHTFQQCLAQIRYKNAQIDYFHRNHFTGLDWNLNNQKQGFLKDITLNITDRQHRPVALIARAIIDKPNWYQHKTLQDIKLKHPNPRLQAARLAELKKLGKKQPVLEETIPYLPFTALFDANGKPNDYLFSQIPHGAIIEIVRPNWDLTQTAGTHLNVSHMGFAFRKGQNLLFRNASSQAHRVIDVSLIDYLKTQIKSPTVKGIHVQVPVSGRNCSSAINR